MHRVRIGTRGSALALRQSEMVAELLRQADPGVTVELVRIRTAGDRIQDRSLARIGGKGLFIREIEQQLLEGGIDLAVHSGKDLPARCGEPFRIAAVLPRGAAQDVLLVREGSEAERRIRQGEGEGLAIGTSSPRRETMVRRLLPGCRVSLLRGNVPTRLSRLRAGDFDAILLAAAGLERLCADTAGLTRFVLDPERFVPAACQGIIACECLQGSPVQALLSGIDDAATHRIFDAERELMALLGADCHDAAGVYAREPEEGTMQITAFYQDSPVRQVKAPAGDPVEALRELARALDGERGGAQ